MQNIISNISFVLGNEAITATLGMVLFVVFAALVMTVIGGKGFNKLVSIALVIVGIYLIASPFINQVMASL